MQIRHVLLSIMALMSTPNPGAFFEDFSAHCMSLCRPEQLSYSLLATPLLADDPLANDIAEVWKTDIAKALANAREWTAKYASA